MADRKQKIKLGIAGAAAVLSAFSGVWIALPLLLIAALFFAWSLEARRTEELIGRVPGGNYVLTALAKVDSIISNWS